MTRLQTVIKGLPTTGLRRELTAQKGTIELYELYRRVRRIRQKLRQQLLSQG